MKKTSLLILIFSMLFLFSCQKDEVTKSDIFIARAVLIEAKYGVAGGFGSIHWWELKFDNKMVIAIVDGSSYLAHLHFVEGAEYDIYKSEEFCSYSKHKVRKVND